MRPVEISDAEALIEMMREITSEPGINLPWSPGEFQMTVEEEKEFLQKYVNNDRAQWLVAIDDSKVIGSCEVKCYERSGIRHIATLGISIRQSHRGKGVGNALVGEMLNWARQRGDIKRVELWVFARNLPAINLYLKHGFKFEGKRTAAVLKDGEYLDDYLMGMILQ